MAVSATLSLAGAGNGAIFYGEFEQVGRVNSKLCKRPTKHFDWFCLNGHQILHANCYWQIPRNGGKLQNFKSRDLPLPLAYGKGAKVMTYLQNVSEDTDDMFDDLFRKYGKVVFRSNEQKPPTAEVDDDAESLSFAVEMAKVASDVKAGDIKVLFVKPLVYWTRFFIIVTAFSRPQIDAIGSRIRDLAEKKYGKVPSGDTKPNSWTLLDFGDVVIHIFLPPQRAFYNLEEFYGNATLIELPFENQPPFRG
ncbi:Oligomerisation domain-containing protein [Cephalotus follicularis]|uniref:Protein Iojap, chloroplastic n=1 Tax=Cephalotus follicularis TaxID=3775 RepID=A0A1Q3B819_CEPFO|nr:Oligomerisation domain-containing protein [Cephalotus follicularis]